MPLSINTNIASLTSQRAMLNTGRELETAFERLSTGKRVNTAVDDAAGLAIAERLTGRINGCLLYTSPSPRDAHESRMPSSA